MQWYILQVYPGSENKVSNAIKDKAEEKGLSSNISQILVPTVETAQIRYGKKVNISKPILTGYILVEMDLSNELMSFILAIPKVMGFTGQKDKVTNLPFPISQSEVDSFLKTTENATSSINNDIKLDIGEAVDITSGPFESFKGTVEEIDSNKNKIKVSVSIFGRATLVELELDQIKKIN